MNKNQIYIVTAVAIVVLGLIFWKLDTSKKVEVADENVEVTNTETTTPSPSPTPSVRPPTLVPPPQPTIGPSAPAPKPVPTIPTAAILNGSTFYVTSYNGKAVSSDTNYSLSFTEGSLSAKFCNSLNSNYSLDGSLLKTSNLIGTRMYCATPASLMEMENALVSMLDIGATIYKSGNSIVLSSSNNGTVIVFAGL